MTINHSQSSSDYLRDVASLAERLAEKKIAIYEHRFTYLAFCSWEIVAGRRDKQLRFTYDGKDSYLSYCDSSIKPQNHHDLQHKHFATYKGEDPLMFVGGILEKEFPSE